MRIFRGFVICILCLTMFTGPAGADWVTNWISSSSFSGSGPAAYEFSSRTYFTGGYGSLRWEHNVLTPISFTPPSLRFGCGGVDIFLGSMGLLGFDYIVDRLKTIMYSAGAFAFEYALHDLCPICQQILRGLDAASDFLNQLQLDECRAGKAVAATIMKPFSDEAQADYTTLITKKQLFAGVADAWREFSDKVKSDAGSDETRQVNNTEKAGSVASCGAFFQDLTDASRGNYSILRYLASRLGGGDFYDILDLIRGLAGDVFLAVDGSFAFVYEPGCGDYDSLLAAFITGRTKKETFRIVGTSIRTECEDANEGASIKTYCKNLLSDYYTKLAAKQNPPSGFDDFVKIVGFDYYKELRLAYQVGLAGPFITDESLIVTCSAYTYAASLLRNILSEAIRLRAEVGKEYNLTCAGNRNPSGCVLCKNGVMDNFYREINELIDNLRRVYSKVEREYEKRVLAADSPCQSWKMTQKALLELDRMVKTPLVEKQSM